MEWKHETKESDRDPMNTNTCCIPENSREGAWLVVHGVAKKANVKNLMSSASAFGCSGVCIVGQTHAPLNPPLSSDMHIVFFKKISHCKEWFHQGGIALLGVEIDPSAVDLDSAEAFKPPKGKFKMGSIAFMLGNEGSGLSEAQKALCDRLIYIRQPGIGTASLNVAVAGSIVLHSFLLWSQLGDKSDDDAKPSPPRSRTS